ncbi:MAG: DUF6427 family protein [Rikenellaceae bacterium]
MTFDISRQSPLSTILLFLLLAAIFWSSSVMTSPEPLDSFTPIAQSIDRWALDNSSITLIITAAIMIWISFLITRLTIRRVEFLEKSYLPALVFIVVGAGYNNSELSLRPLLSTLSTVYAINLLIRGSYYKGLSSGIFIVSGAWVGVSILLFIQSIILIPMLFLGLIVFRRFDLREWLSLLAGVILPIALTLLTWYILDYDLLQMWDNIIYRLSRYNGDLDSIFRNLNTLHWSFIITIVILFIISVVSYLTTRRHRTVKYQSPISFFIWFTLFICAMSLLTPLRTIYYMPLVALPLSILLSSSFNGRKASFFSNFLYAMLIITAVAITIFPTIEQLIN